MVWKINQLHKYRIWTWQTLVFLGIANIILWLYILPAAYLSILQLSEFKISDQTFLRCFGATPINEIASLPYEVRINYSIITLTARIFGELLLTGFMIALYAVIYSKIRFTTHVLPYIMLGLVASLIYTISLGLFYQFQKIPGFAAFWLKALISLKIALTIIVIMKLIYILIVRKIERIRDVKNC